MIYHNSQNLKYRTPFGAVTVNSSVSLTVTADFACGAVVVSNVNGTETRYEMHKADGDDFTVEIKMPSEGTLFWYYFLIYYPSGEECIYGAPYDRLGGEGQEYAEDPVSYQITVYKQTETADWYKNGIIYQIFPDRFAKGSDLPLRKKNSGRELVKNWYKKPEYLRNPDGSIKKWDFYGGTLKGIEEKLPYLKKLGITVIYLNPIFKASTNHRYDTVDYTEIDPLLGDDDSFLSLCVAAKKEGIHIMFDGVFSHTGKDSIYFKKDSPYRKWFNIHEDGTYDCWWGITDLPEVDETNPSYVDYICGPKGVIHKWIGLGADGIRLDVADELPDSFIKHVRNRMKAERKDSVLLGEVWEDASNKFSHGEQRMYFMGDELDSTMNYPVRDIILTFAEGAASSSQLRRFMSLVENYPKENLYSAMNLLGSHDRERLLTRLGGDRLKLAMLYKLMFAMPGVPCIYYGDEAGLTGNADPENRACYPWEREDKVLVDFFMKLTEEYHSHPALKYGDFTPLYLNDQVFAFIRSCEEETIIVFSNNTSNDVTVFVHGVEYAIPALNTIYKVI